jgi:ubiquinone/menaquinone biosynthesis C-methylase UbiE
MILRMQATRARRYLVLGVLALLFCGTPFMLRAQDAHPADYDSLKTLFDQAYQSRDYQAALEIGKALDEIAAPMHYETLYNMARVHALLGNAPKAYEYLKKAVDAGFWDIQRMRKDDDFAAIRDEQLFKDLSRAAWANGYIGMLERDEREEFQKSPEIMHALALEPGECVADVGAGSGYFTIPIAKAVGPTGRVLAIDIRQEMLDYIAERLKAEHLENVELMKVEPDDPLLPPGGVDLILMVDTIHYIKERTRYAEKLRAGLAPAGRLVIIDYIPKSWDERPWGPPPEQHLPKETLNADLAKAGLKVVKEYDFLPEQYFVVYQAQ